MAYEVAKRLSKLIEDGVLPAGTRLVELDLARQLGVSRGPLREALRILETMAIVDAVPGRGCYVAALSRADARELYSLRILLEPEAAKLAAGRHSSQDIEILQEIFASMLSSFEKKDYSALEGADMRFHQKIWEMSANRRLRQTLDGLVNVIRRYHSMQTHLYQSPMVGVTDHGEILAAISQREPSEAADAMRRHMTKAAEIATQNLPEILEEVPA